MQLRLASPDDLKFIRHSWFESYRQGGCAPQVGFPVYKKGQGARINRLLNHASCVIAYLPSVPDEIIGWACADESVCHYVYVKQAYRRQGVARLLCKGLPEYTHETRVGRSFFAQLGSHFNPYKAEP